MSKETADWVITKEGGVYKVKNNATNKSSKKEFDSFEEARKYVRSREAAKKDE